MKYITTWYGEPIENLSHIELIEVINFLANELNEYRTPQAIHAHSLGVVEMLKREEKKISIKSLYIIGSLRNRDEVIAIANEIRALGIEAFDDWLSPGPEADDKWRDYETQKDHNYKEALEGWAAKHVFEFDKYHLDRCDGGVLILPAGKSGHLEAGYIARTKPLFILMDDPSRWDVMVLFAKNSGGGVAFSRDELKEMIQNY